MSVTDKDALDRAWFIRNPHRQFRRRQAGDSGIDWIIFKPDDGMLWRVPDLDLPNDTPDTDEALREAWIRAAWSFLSPAAREELTKQIRGGATLQ